MNTESLIAASLVEFKKKKSNILNIYKDRLCNYCGACYLICPVDAIEYKDGILTINENCTYCDECLDICSQNQEFRYKTEFREKENNERILDIDKSMSKIPFGDLFR